MAHPIFRVKNFEFAGAHSLRVFFDDATEQTIDFLPVLFGEIYRHLRDPEFFRQVTIDPVAQTLAWPNGADFDPTMLHDWPMRREAFEAKARRWEPAPTR